jgi:WhiB family redox-sensing transcriptional regulator
MNWLDFAACLGVDPDLFFAVPGGPAGGRKREDMARAKEAKRVCGGCPVVVECGDYAVTTRQPEGVWGGKTPKQRQQERARRRAA